MKTLPFALTVTVMPPPPFTEPTKVVPSGNETGKEPLLDASEGAVAAADDCNAADAFTLLPPLEPATRTKYIALPPLRKNKRTCSGM